MHIAKWRETTVAVKKMKVDQMAAADYESFIGELALMKSLRPHQYVVQFLGVCEKPLAIVTEVFF